jgi:hypothetical protein
MSNKAYPEGHRFDDKHYALEIREAYRDLMSAIYDAREKGLTVSVEFSDKPIKPLSSDLTVEVKVTRTL